MKIIDFLSCYSKPEFFLLWNELKSVSFPIDFHIMDIKYNGSQWEPKLFSYSTNIILNILFWVLQNK